MGLSHSPSIVTNGLVFAYDMENTQKSWKGAPVTNQFTLPTADVNGFGVQDSTFTRIRSGSYGGYDIQPTDYVWRYDITGPACPYHGWDIPTTSGTVVTFSFDYYVSPTCVGYPSTNFLANFENVGSGVGGSIADPTPSIIGVWKRLYFSSTASATGNSRCLLYPGACGPQLATSGFVLFKNPQVEFNAPGSVPTPFVDGTRSTTQAILDQTSNNTITANSLTYASDGTFSFNGSTNRISSGYSAALTDFTIGVWFKASGNTGGYDRIIDKLYTTGTMLMRNASAANSWGGGVLEASPPYGRFLTLTDGQWHYLVSIRSGTTHTLYGDGVTNTVSGTVPSTALNTNQFGIGSWYDGSGQYFNGNIPIVQIYNRALSAAEVQQNFNVLRGRYGV